MAARLARLAAVRSNVPDAALCNTIAIRNTCLNLTREKLFRSKMEKNYPSNLNL